MNKYERFVVKYFEEILAGGFVAVAATAILGNMLSRCFMREELWWSEEAATFCFVWSVFLGIAAVYKRGIHIGVDVFVRRMPDSIRKTVNFLMRAVLLTVNGYLLWLSTKYVGMSLEKQTAVLGIPYTWFGGALVVSFGLTTWYSVSNLMDCIKNFSGSEEA